MLSIYRSGEIDLFENLDIVHIRLLVGGGWRDAGNENSKDEGGREEGREGMRARGRRGGGPDARRSRARPLAKAARVTLDVGDQCVHTFIAGNHHPPEVNYFDVFDKGDFP